MTSPKGAPGEWPQEPKQCVKDIKLNSEQLLSHLKQSGIGQRINGKVSKTLEIVLTPSDCLLELLLDVFLKGVNVKFECLLCGVNNI